MRCTSDDDIVLEWSGGMPCRTEVALHHVSAAQMWEAEFYQMDLDKHWLGAEFTAGMFKVKCFTPRSVVSVRAPQGRRARRPRVPRRPAADGEDSDASNNGAGNGVDIKSESDKESKVRSLATNDGNGGSGDDGIGRDLARRVRVARAMLP